MGSEETPILAAAGIHRRFGALVVLDGVDFSVGAGDAIGIVGPNGAGKTTLLNVLSGALRPSEGSVAFRGADVTRAGVSKRCRLGIGRAHQVPKPFGDLTVFENVFVGAATGGGLRGQAAYDRCIEVLELCGLVRVREPAGRHARPARPQEARARSRARNDPVVLLLDEIGAGLTDAEADELVGTIRDVRSRGVAIVWIEHIVHVLVQVVERLVCLDAGKVIADGDPDAVMRDAAVVDAYLGGVAAMSSVARCRGSRLATGCSRRCAASRSRLPRARRSPSSARTAPARRRSCARSPAPTSLRPAGFVFDGDDVTRVRAHDRLRRGIALVPEGRRLFPDLTVEENLLVAARSDRKGRWTLDTVLEAFPLLKPLRDRRAASLSGGEQQATAIGRALISNPRLLLLDEVSLGLAPIAVEAVYRSLETLIEEGTTIVLVEQDLNRATSVAEPRRLHARGQARARGRQRADARADHRGVLRAQRGRRRRDLDERGRPGRASSAGSTPCSRAGSSLMFGLMRIVNLAHGDIAVLGAYLITVVLDHWGVSPFIGFVAGPADHARARLPAPARRSSSGASARACSCRC